MNAPAVKAEPATPFAAQARLRAHAIVVPEDLYRTTLTKDLKDWTQIFYQFGLGAAAIQIIRN